MTDGGGPVSDREAGDRILRRAAGVRSGDTRAIGRAISEVERDSAAGRRIVAALAAHVGRAHRVGITGPPGAGKSSLVAELALAHENLGARVGVVAIDPSSRATGGAVLGDRLRMTRHESLDRVYIRSLGSRGDQGGLSLAATRIADVLDAAGYDPIFIETVGAGQDEVEVNDIAHTRVVVLPPGLGDDVQAAKAGLMEIADVFVVSKCDRAGAEHAIGDLTSLVGLRAGGLPAPVIVGTSTVDGRGIGRLVEVLCERSNRRPRGLAERAIARLIMRRALRETEAALARLPATALADLGARVRGGELTLGDAARAALAAIDGSAPPGPRPFQGLF